MGNAVRRPNEGRRHEKWPAPLVEVTRGYLFSAAHRLHNPRLSLVENRRVYGRCNHPSGHGHSYRLEVTIRGPVSFETGGVADGNHLDQVVRTRVLQRFDRKDLNVLIRPADGPTSTTEALGAVLWRILDRALPSGRLWRLRLEETPNNFFEFHRSDVKQTGNMVSPVPEDGGQKVSPA